MSEQKKQITVNTGKDCFFYKGYILEDTSEYIKFKDDRDGVVKIYKHSIIAISNVKGGNNG